MPLDFAADPVFGQFAPWSGAAKAGFHAGYLGEMTDARFIEPGGRLFHKIGANADPGSERHEAGSYPPVREEIIEWHALLSAVLASRERFVMVDCGAGFGRWLVSAAQALRRLSLPFNLVGVEAEPTHFAWMEQHLRNNGIDPAEHKLLHAAIGGESGTIELLAGGDPAKWYGQTLANTFHGQYAKSQHQLLSVPCLSLGALLRDLDIVDFLDLDIQGSEEKAVATGIDAMTEKVRRVYVGTHMPHVDGLLDIFFQSRGWHCAARHDCGSTADTEFGSITFPEGQQYWINPRLTPPAAGN
jgi:FkbM family methyltransferase